MSDPPAPVRRQERFAAILEALAQTGSAHVDELAARFHVSTATLRRDLALLEEQRLLTRTHGGARAQDMVYDLPASRDSEHDDLRAVARAAARRVPAGPYVVGLTGGAATSELAHTIADRADLTIVTNALNIAAALTVRPRLKVMVTGGVTQPGGYDLTGPWAEQTLADVYIGTAFVTADAVDADAGLTAAGELGARTALAMLERARRVVALAPGSALGAVMFARVAPVGALHEVITDASADDESVARLRAAGVEVTVAGR